MRQYERVTGKLMRTGLRFNLLSALGALLLWGGWAFYVNRGFGFATGLISGVTQGSASFAITLAMVNSVAWLFHRLPANPLRLILPSVITVSISGTCLATIHGIVGTPRVLHTIWPALTVAFLFCLFTTFRLRNAEAGKDAQA